MIDASVIPTILVEQAIANNSGNTHAALAELEDRLRFHPTFGWMDENTRRHSAAAAMMVSYRRADK